MTQHGRCLLIAISLALGVVRLSANDRDSDRAHIKSAHPIVLLRSASTPPAESSNSADPSCGADGSVNALTVNRSAWPEFRGRDREGVSAATGVPLQWSDNENIVWKTPLPGRGASSPIIWGDHIYVTAYSGYGLVNDDPFQNLGKLKRHLICVNLNDGEILWKADWPTSSAPKEHPIVQFLDLHGYASSTPVADDEGVYVYYGTDGVVAYRHDGQKRWDRKLGNRSFNWGSASSPILFENFIVVHADIEAQALVAMEKQTGREVWRVPTGERDSWSTPLVLEVDGHHELIFHHSVGTPATVMAVDPRTGSERWKCRVLQDYLCPSPIAHGGVIYMLAHQKGAAVRAGGQGDVSGSHVQWTINKGTEVCTPIYHQGYLYWAHQEDGFAYCVNAKTGEIVSQQRLRPPPGRMYASGVLVDDRIYYVSRENGTYVVAAKPQFELLAHNRIQSDRSVFNGTPAISQGRILLRSDSHLYCIGMK